MKGKATANIRSLIGVALPLGFVIRSAIHVFTALAFDRNPRLETDLEPPPEGATDVRLSSPVPSLRGEPADMVARLACAAFAFLMASLFPLGDAPAIAVYWVVLNWLVLVVDPVVGVGLLAWERRLGTAINTIQ